LHLSTLVPRSSSSSSSSSSYVHLGDIISSSLRRPSINVSFRYRTAYHTTSTLARLCVANVSQWTELALLNSKVCPEPFLHIVFPVSLTPYIVRGRLQWGALIRMKKTENGAKQDSAVKTKWLLIVFWGPPNNIKKVNFNFVCP
jgi:hypothetical protein